MNDPKSTAAIPDGMLDLGRAARCGYPEVVYGPGKEPQTIVAAFEQQQLAGQSSLATRLDEAQSAALAGAFPDLILNARAKTARLMVSANEPASGKVSVVTAGSSDLPVAEEALETLRWMRVDAELITDVGVAGPQRLLGKVEQLQQADVLVVAAGMEGALPSVVAGWVGRPVIAVPTSVGYGANLNGLAALLSMLNSCAANVAVVNIDAGFKGGYLAGMIAQRG